MTEGDAVSLRDYVDSRFKEYERRFDNMEGIIEDRLRGTDKAIAALERDKARQDGRIQITQITATLFGLLLLIAQVVLEIVRRK